MTIIHHPNDSTLMSYAAGSLPEALSAVVATHLDMCPHCRGELRLMERIGLACVAVLPETEKVRPVSFARARSAEARDEPVTRLQALGQSSLISVGAASTNADVPAPLRPFVGFSIDDISWKRLGIGVWHHPLPLSEGATGDLRLLKVAAGRAMPEHGHGGTELTLILRGAYTDEIGRFAAGDIADLDQEIEHRPIVDQGADCICLVASEQPARFKSLLPRLVQPLTGM